MQFAAFVEEVEELQEQFNGTVNTEIEAMKRNQILYSSGTTP